MGNQEMKVKKIAHGRSKYYIHTHDLIAYRRCRRKWALTSPLRLHLKPRADRMGVSPYLWMGSGFHFGLEDRFSYNRFGSSVRAFEAYVEAHPVIERPVDWEELQVLCSEMLDYYEKWETKHGKWKTLWIDGVPMVEVNFALELEEITYNGAPLAFGGTFDRIVEDEHGRYWIMDYKTAKAFDTAKLNLDTQVSAYCWAAEQYLGIPIEGMIYVQIHKSTAKPPKVTKKGISVDKRQRTTADLYRQALIDMYGTSEDTPEENLEFLRGLIEKEKKQEELGEGDDFVRVDWVERNEWTKINFYHHLMNMASEMVREDLPIYPNPTKDCSWDCSFKEICLAKEEGADWECYMDMYEGRNETLDDEEPQWLLNIKKKYPNLYVD